MCPTFTRTTPLYPVVKGRNYTLNRGLYPERYTRLRTGRKALNVCAAHGFEEREKCSKLLKMRAIVLWIKVDHYPTALKSPVNHTVLCRDSGAKKAGPISKNGARYKLLMARESHPLIRAELSTVSWPLQREAVATRARPRAQDLSQGQARRVAAGRVEEWNAALAQPWERHAPTRHAGQAAR